MQTEYSLWTRNPELGVLGTCRELGVSFVAFSPVAREALARVLDDRAQSEASNLRKNHLRFTKEFWQTVR
jgi:aryl-alcohol dehydrogenase-like predicted oxidoreductase